MAITELSPTARKNLAAGYSDSAFCAMNQDVLAGLYAPAQVLTDPVLSAYYGLGGHAALLDPKSREIAILSVLGTTRGSALNQAIHVYVGLALGITVADVAGVYGAVGAYAGADKLVDGLKLLQTVLDTLKPLANAGVVPIKTAIGALVKAVTPLTAPAEPAPPEDAPPEDAGDTRKAKKKSGGKKKS